MISYDSKFWNQRRGQSLIELLVAISIGAILIIAAISVIVPALLTNRQVTPLQTGTSLGAELLNNVRAWSEGDWHNVLALATGTANLYYLNTSSSPFLAVGASSTGGQVIVIASATYLRSFYLMDVYRTGGLIATSGGAYDPSTKLAAVMYQLPSGATSGLATYVTRHGQVIYDETDWSGGPGANGPATTTNSQFSTSSGVNYSTTTGSIYVAIPGY